MVLCVVSVNAWELLRTVDFTSVSMFNQQPTSGSFAELYFMSDVRNVCRRRGSNLVLLKDTSVSLHRILLQCKQILMGGCRVFSSSTMT